MLTFTGIKITPSQKLIDEYIIKLKTMNKNIIINELLRNLNIKNIKWQKKFRILCIIEILITKNQLNGDNIKLILEKGIPIINKCKTEQQLANKINKVVNLLNNYTPSEAYGNEMLSTQKSNDYIPTSVEATTSTEVQSSSLSPAVSSPLDVTTTVPLGVEASSNYLSLKGRATPRDRGSEGCDGSSIMGMMEDGAKDLLDVTSSGMKSSTGPRVEPVADLWEAKGEVNRRADGRTISGGREGNDWTSSGNGRKELRWEDKTVNSYVESEVKSYNGRKESLINELDDIFGSISNSKSDVYSSYNRDVSRNDDLFSLDGLSLKSNDTQLDLFNIKNVNLNHNNNDTFDLI